MHFTAETQMGRNFLANRCIKYGQGSIKQTWYSDETVIKR